MAHYNAVKRRTYDELEDDTLIDVTTAQARYQATQQVLLNPEKYGKEIKDNALFEALDEIISELEGRKIIVYAWFNSTVDFLCERYAHLNPAKINGSVTGDARENEKQKFIQNGVSLNKRHKSPIGFLE